VARVSTTYDVRADHEGDSLSAGGNLGERDLAERIEHQQGARQRGQLRGRGEVSDIRNS